MEGGGLDLTEMSTARGKGKGKGNNNQGKGDFIMEDTREELNKQEHYNQPTDTSKQEIQRTAKGWEPIAIEGKHEGGYFDKEYRGSRAQQTYNKRVSQLETDQDENNQRKDVKGYRLAWNDKRVTLYDAIN